MSRKKKQPEKTEWSYAEWWIKNRTDVLEKRRKRYRQDAVYRKQILDSAKKRRDEQETPKKKVKSTEKRAPGKRGFPRPKVVMLNDEQVVLQSFGFMRAKTGLHKLTLTKWLEEGVLPECSLTDDQGRRWYPEQFVEFVRRVVQIREDERETGGKWWFLENFKMLVQAEWIKARKRGLVPDMSVLAGR